MAIMTDGYKTTISFAADPTVLFEEVTVTPPGVQGGGAIDQTNMHNTDYRTSAPKALMTLSDGGAAVHYDPATYDEILALVNVNNLITITWPDGATLAFWGWLDSFAPGELSEGEKPTASLTIIPSNLNDSNVETAPVHTDPA